MRWRTPRPQMITSMALVICETLRIYSDFIGGNELSEYFDPKLDDLHDRVLDLVEAHEKYLAAKQWPEI
jgi:hypothetical protein